MTHPQKLVTWQLRAQFAAGLSAMYAAEVPAYGTLVEVSEQVNRDYAARHPDAERLGSLERVTAERHGAIRVGSPAELAAVADLFAAFGMHPVGYYDLRSAASPVPVVSTAFRPIDADELARNPFRVFTSMLATRDPRFFDADLRTRVETFLARRQLFDPALLAQARIDRRRRRLRRRGGAGDFVAAAVGGVRAVARTDRQGLVRRAVAGVRGGRRHRRGRLHPHQPPDAARARHRRAVPADDRRGITMIDAIQGPPRTDGPDVLLRQTSFRALAEPRLFRGRDGSRRPRAACGCGSARSRRAASR